MRQLLDDAVSDFLRFRSSQGLSKNTLANDRTTLKQFMAANGNIWMHQIDTHHAMRWAEESSRTRKASSQGVAFSTLAKFFAWARHTKRMPTDRDPLFGMRRPKTVRRERQRVPASRFGHMLDVAGETSPYLRALTATLLYTLLRGSEVTDLRIRDVDLENGYLMARIHKTRQEDRVPISAELDRELRAWLTAYTEEVGPLKPHYYLLPARKGKPVFSEETHRIIGGSASLRPEQRAGGVARLMNPVLERVGIDVSEGGEGGHTIRRSGARALFDRLSEDHHPRPLRVVRDMLHHASEAQTERYVGAEADRLDRDAVLRGRFMFGGPAKVVAIREVN